MKRSGRQVARWPWRAMVWLVYLVGPGFLGDVMAAESTGREAPRYETRRDHSPDGIGKFYMGREIAWVMGHQAAEWLERTTREEEEKTSLLVSSLPLEAGMTVADIGAGSGYFTRRLAQAVAPGGRVLAVDIQPEMLEILTNKLAAERVTNVVAVLGTETDPRLPAGSADLALLVDVYHEFSHPYEMMRSIVRGLKPGGRVVLVEYRGEDPAVPIKPLHKMTADQVKKEMAVQDLEFDRLISVLPRQHILIFRKPVEGAP